MNVASDARADEPRVRLCFFVNVRNANGRRDAGGNSIGRMVGIAGLNTGCAGGLMLGLYGCNGVPNAGDDDGKAFSCNRTAAAMLSPAFLLCRIVHFIVKDRCEVHA